MPDFTKFGDPQYKWAFEDAAAPVVAGMKITELNLDTEPEFTAEAMNENGLVAAFVKSGADKDKKNFSASGFILDADDLLASESFQFRNRFYIILKKGEKYNHRDFQKCDISGVSYALIGAGA
jgi:predicted transcriptional regulator